MLGCRTGLGRLFSGSALALLAVAALASSAHASSVHPFVSWFGSLGSPQSVAVDQATGDLYVLDPSNGTVNKFDSSGNPANFSALGGPTLDGAGGGDCSGTPADCDQTPQNGFAFDWNGAAQVAVDNTAGPTAHFIYVTNSFYGVVDVFDQTGTYVGEIDGSAATPQSGGEVCGVAVSPGGDVYVSSVAGHVDHYTVADANPANDVFVSQLENLFIPGNVAVDSAGAAYVVTLGFGPLNKYDASQFGTDTPSGTQVDGTSTSVAIDPTNDQVYVDEGNQIAQFDSSGTLLGHSGTGILTGSSFGVAIHGSTGEVFASDAGTGQIAHFGPAVDIDPPTVTIDPVTDITSESATFSGTVNPQGSDPASDTSWHFEYSTDGGNSWASTTGGDAGTGTNDVPVSEGATGLLPHQDVQVRLVATNAAGSTTSDVFSFTTEAIAPDVTTEPAEDVALTHASLQGLIHPHNAPTTYYFEYGTTTAYGTSIPAAQNGDAGSGNLLEGVANPIYGLQPATTYHYRLIATNAAGTTTGNDQTFTTTTSHQPTACFNTESRQGHAAVLPDCRAWEMVSPPNKNGGDVIPNTQRTHAASGQSPGLPIAVSFASLNGFGDVHGTGIATEYVAQRALQPNTNGWTTHATTPLQQPVNLTAATSAGNQDPHYVGDFSRDLNHAVFAAWSPLPPLTDAQNVKDVPNLYLRNDLRTPGLGSWTLLTNAASPLAPSLAFSNFADGSTDFSHVIFESFQSLTPEVPPCTPGPLGAGCDPHLYEAINGVVRLVGILPDGSIAPNSVAGQGVNPGVSGSNFTYHTISDDGRRIFFTVAQRRSSDLYLRSDGTSTVQINAPEDGLNPERATFWDAASDGSRAFFTSRTTGHVYMYSVQPDGSGHHLIQLDVDQEPQDGSTTNGVIGSSDDGHYVYFIEAGQLVAGKPVLRADRAVYVWHDETGSARVDYVGRFEFGGTFQNLNHSWQAWPTVSRVTPDGGHLLFAAISGTGLTGYDQVSTCQPTDFDSQVGCTELYVYSVHGDGPDHAHLHCASCNPSGAPATADATDNVQATPDSGAAYPTNHASHAISDDGRFVFFHTSEALVPQDVNGKLDAYEYDLSDRSVHLLSSGTDTADAYFSDASTDGHDVFISTRGQLVGWDRDAARDLYDARIGGGVPNPPPATLPCTEDPCKGPLIAAPAAPAIDNATEHSTGDVKAGPRAKRKHKRLVCRRGFVKKRVKKRVRCVRKPRHRHRRHAVRRARRATGPASAERKGR